MEASEDSSHNISNKEKTISGEKVKSEEMAEKAITYFLFFACVVSNKWNDSKTTSMYAQPLSDKQFDMILHLFTLLLWHCGHWI
jgi:hypothetical protein